MSENEKMNIDQKNGFICHYCGKSFDVASYLSKHIKKIHEERETTEDGNILNLQFMCDLCGKQYIYKHSLQRHMDSAHLSKKTFSCDLCNYKASRQYLLKKHINSRIHNKPDNYTVPNFKCAYCPSKFRYKTNLRRHENKIHNIERFFKITINRKCPLCPFTSSTKSKQEINHHFKIKHDLKMECQKIVFQSMKEFYDWKNTLETESNASFVKARHCTKQSLYYLCHRSGNFKSRGSSKRHLKSMGSCKINAHCPCEIVARCNKDGSVSVSYLSTHVGHNNDLKFLRLRPEDKKSIAAKLLSKTPHHEILRTIRSSVSNNELKRIHLINSKDLFNIKKSFNIKKESEKHPNDAVSLDDCVQESMKIIKINEKNKNIIEESVLTDTHPYDPVSVDACIQESIEITTINENPENIIEEIVLTDNHPYDAVSLDDCVQESMKIIKINENRKNIIEESVLTGVSKENIVGGKEAKLQKSMDLVKKIFEEAKTDEQITFVDTALKAMYNTVKALASTAEQQIQSNPQIKFLGKIQNKQKKIRIMKKNVTAQSQFTNEERKQIALYLLKNYPETSK